MAKMTTSLLADDTRPLSLKIHPESETDIIEPSFQPTDDNVLPLNSDFGSEDKTSDHLNLEEELDSDHASPVNYFNDSESDTDDGPQLQQSSASEDSDISKLLLEYQFSTQTSKAAMEKLLKVIHQIVDIQNSGREKIPNSYYLLTKNYEDVEEKVQIRFVCHKCSTLT